MKTRYIVIEKDNAGNELKEIKAHGKANSAQRQSDFLNAMRSGSGLQYEVKVAQR